MAKGVLFIFLGSLFSQVIPFLALPILSNLYTPLEFGFYSTILAWVGVLSAVAFLRYEVAIVTVGKERHARAILYFCQKFKFIVFVVMVLISSVLYLVIRDGLLIFIPVALYFSMSYILKEKVLNREQGYGVLSLGRIIKSSVECFVSLGFGYFAISEFGLVYGVIAGFSAGAFFLAYSSEVTTSSFKKGYVAQVLQRYSDFPKYSAPQALLNNLTTNSLILLIPFFYGSHILGVFAFGYKIVQAPLGIISKAIQVVLYRHITKKINNRESVLKELFGFIFVLSFLCIIIVFLMYNLDKIFTFFFDETWSEGARYIKILTPWLIVSFFGSQFSFFPIVLGEQKKSMFFEFFYFLSRTLPFLILWVSGEDDFELLLYMISWMSSSISFFILLWYAKLWYQYEKSLGM
ncbi:oligosaccharide flippase family protein [Pseudoalteromonas sp. A41-2]|uniref:lipopolysaccharide biosynthesis protein n=1 Tax=Pseudoalteromonas sp. A41-2 TaxID=2785910 RepID=UPI0018CB956B|nr:oligosaccharide flippase family protein [Pseudoalteromonas sp. A41-2]QPL42598.1 oligosaccharide flippase family protein [Pseudoalteromonas sp. A41-2]|tara:strand:+ start:4452 stop:5669 length:1218 start_codon:yes stop_codon:yes gene_type:complete